MNSSKKIAFNTIILYSKMVITLLITLYSTRIALEVLGATDYGIFTLVAGVVLMLSFLNTAMSISTQRFFSYYLGKKNGSSIKDIFDNSLTLHFIIALIIVFFLEFLGLILFNGLLNIPPERITASYWIYHFMVISSFFTVISVPFDAIINANENMVVVAILSIIDAVGKLLIVLLIINYQFDKLIFYGALLSIQSVVLTIIKRKYCISKYYECGGGFKLKYEKKIFKELFYFAGWSFYGTMCGVFRSQGIVIVLNFFFGTIVNAAYGIANQVNGQLSYFSSSLLLAFNPQIMKSEGAGERDRMLYLSVLTSKYSFYLLMLFSIPLIIEIEYVLKLWLKNVPEYTTVFCQLILLLTLINQLTIGLQSSALAVGKIKMYQLTIGTINLMAPLIGFFALKYSSWEPYFIVIITIFVEIIAGVWRIIFLKKLAGLSIAYFVKNVIFPCLMIFFVVFASTYIAHYILINVQPFLKLIIISLFSGFLSLLLVYIIGITSIEREQLLSVIKNKLKRNEK